MSIDEAYGLYDATGLAGLVVSNEVKVAELVEVAITRIEEQNPRLNAVVLPAFADAQDRVAAGVPQGPLHGVPYLVKDLNTNVAGLPSTNGSRALRDVVPTVDSVLVGRMRDAGLVVLGKTNTPEMGMGVCTSPALRGPTPNPFDSTRSAGGSSGGSACAVASGMLPAAHATDSGGSIRIPASNCGLFGLKPTRGRVPLGNDAAEGLDGLSTSHAVTHSVRDSALLLDVTHGPSPGSPPDIATVPSSVGGFVSAIDGPLRPLRIALWTEGLANELVDETCQTAAYQAAGLAEVLGCAVAEVRPPVDGGPCEKHCQRCLRPMSTPPSRGSSRSTRMETRRIFSSQPRWLPTVTAGESAPTTTARPLTNSTGRPGPWNSSSRTTTFSSPRPWPLQPVPWG